MPTIVSKTAEIEVLHVDDEPDFLALVTDMLERENSRFSVETAPSASEGLDQLTDGAFDCIVSDYQMPGETGIEFLATIREEYPDLPFILYTGKGSEEVASDAIAAGATDYLQKSGSTDQYELLANRIQNAVEQYRAQQRAATFDRIRTLRRNINRALVHADSRSGAETRICEIIADDEPYLFAWVGEVDSDTDRIEPRAWAGVEESYLDAVTVSADETATGHGPGGTAVRERRVAVTQNVHEDPEFEPWRADALDRGYQSVAAVPLEHEDTLYGVLGIYSGRPDAFDEEEQALLTELGADIAHAFHSFRNRDTLRRNARAMEEAPIGITLTDPSQDDNPLIYVNERFEDVTGYDSEEAIGRNCRFLQGERTATEQVARIRQAIDAREPVTAELRNYRKDGTEFWNRVTIAPVETEDGTVTNFVGFQKDITERKVHHQQLEALNHVAQELMTADTQAEIFDIGIQTARDLLKLDMNAIHFYDEDANGLVPVAATDAVYDHVGDPPTFTEGDSIAWRAYERGEALAIDDLRDEPDLYNPDTSMRSELYLPLGDYGILIAGSPSPETFDEQDVLLGEILAGGLARALEQIERTEQLRARERELTKQNDRLAEFASIVSHDLRNPLNVAEGRLELARTECDSDHLDAVAHAHERMRALIEDLLKLARQGESVTAVEPVALDSLIEGCWTNVDTGNATLVLETEEIVQADESRLKQLFENLLRNAIEHGGDDVTITVGALGEGFYLEDDGPGIAPDERDEIFEAGYSTVADGTGFGLSIVKQIVEAHDWEIHVANGAEGGARFEITGVEFAAP